MCLRLRAPRAPGSLLTPRSGVPAPHTQPARVPDAAHACRMLAVLRFCAVRASQRRSIHQIAAFCMRFSDRPGAPMRPPTPSPPPPLAGPDHHWWRAGRLCCRHQSRPARPQDRVRGGPRVTGGHLPERGVHSIQGEAQLRGNSHSICTPRCHVQHDRGSHQPTCPLDMHTRACTGLHGGRRSGCTMGGTSFGGRPASAAACRTTRAWLQALLNASHKYHEAAKELHNFGVMASGVTFDWSKMQARGCSGRAGAAVLVRAAPTAGQRAPLQRQQLASVLPCSANSWPACCPAACWLRRVPRCLWVPRQHSGTAACSVNRHAGCPQRWGQTGWRLPPSQTPGCQVGEQAPTLVLAPTAAAAAAAVCKGHHGQGPHLGN